MGKLSTELSTVITIIALFHVLFQESYMEIRLHKFL